MEWSAYIHLLLHAIFIGILLLTFYTVHCMDLPAIPNFLLFSYWGTFYWKCAPEVNDLIFNSPGFDHQHPEVYEHCKRLLLHLLIVQGANSNVQSVAMVLLRNRDFNEPRVLTVKPVAPELNLTGQSKKKRSTIV